MADRALKNQFPLPSHSTKLTCWSFCCHYRISFFLVRETTPLTLPHSVVLITLIIQLSTAAHVCSVWEAKMSGENVCGAKGVGAGGGGVIQCSSLSLQFLFAFHPVFLVCFEKFTLYQFQHVHIFLSVYCILTECVAPWYKHTGLLGV